jgi:hypothetical protein
MGNTSSPTRFPGKMNGDCDETNKDATGRSGGDAMRYGIVPQLNMNKEV